MLDDPIAKIQKDVDFIVDSLHFARPYLRSHHKNTHDLGALYGTLVYMDKAITDLRITIGEMIDVLEVLMDEQLTHNDFLDSQPSLL